MSQPISLARGRETSASAIAPDTEGMNFFADDRGLRDLIEAYLEPELVEHLEPHLDRMGRLAAGTLDRWARLADQNPPRLHVRDRFGNDRQWVEYHPAYQELTKTAFGEFGMHAMSHRGGVLDWPTPLPMVAKHAFTLLFNQAEFGLGCPINVSDSAIHLIRRHGTEALKERFLERMLTQDMTQLWQGAQFMTEKAGGSDVGASTTIARKDGDHWRLYGEKWFCSNVDADVVCLLARPEGAPGGTRGLGLFVMPRTFDGAPNDYRIVRLKDKLGTRSMASGEVVLEGAHAWHLGALDRGFVQMTEMLNWSRLSNGVKSAAIMRRALHDAGVVLRSRVAFGKTLAELPLARRQMIKMMLTAEQALSMSFFTADVVDRAESGEDDEAVRTARLATPVLKFRATRDARKMTGDAMEMRGGCGYVEEFVNARLVRDAHLGSIWEGTSNIVAIDAIQRAVGRNECGEALRATLHRRLDEAINVPTSFRDTVRKYVDGSVDLATTVAKAKEQEVHCRQAVSALYHATTAALLTWEAGRIYAMRGDARRLVLAKLVLEHALAPRNPLAVGSPERESRLGERLLGDAPVAMSDAMELA